jgi:C4-type Zn-finger protein
MTKPMSDEEYVRDTRCPVCGSESLIYSPDVEFGGDFISQPVQCEHCGRHWDQIYVLTGYEMTSQTRFWWRKKP